MSDTMAFLSAHLSSSSQVPSPPPSVADTEDFVTPTHKSVASRSKIMDIRFLLSPSAPNNMEPGNDRESATPPQTPATTPTSTYVTTSQPGTPSTIFVKEQKSVKHAVVTSPPGTQRRVNYPPFELGVRTTCLSSTEQRELERQHKLFQVLPCSENEEDMIADYTRYIPYSSDKKTFGKTGRAGFEVYQYSFRVPGQPTKFTVMWDYVNGLVRITPFFKACNYTKTTPAKALNANAGLKELAHSITGGALDAQGYWMPYSCARSLCATFCYDLRWALTPIYGPSFVHDCLHKDDPRFARFKIEPELVKNAQLEADGWKTPPINTAGIEKAIPRSVPDGAIADETKDLRPRTVRPIFKVDSPFSSDSEKTFHYAPDSPEISPKSTYSSPAWTSINRSVHPTTPYVMASPALENSLLNEPRYVSWPPAEPETNRDHQSKAIPPTKLIGINDKRSTNKRRHSSARQQDPDAEYADSRSGYDAGKSESESDDTDIVIQPSPKKRPHRHRKTSVSTASSSSGMKKAVKKTESRRYHAGDFRAAQWLLNLSMRDADLATGPNGPVQLKK